MTQSTLNIEWNRLHEILRGERCVNVDQLRSTGLLDGLILYQSLDRSLTPGFSEDESHAAESQGWAIDIAWQSEAETTSEHPATYKQKCA
jgi:hypothetical protein